MYTLQQEGVFTMARKEITRTENIAFRRFSYGTLVVISLAGVGWLYLRLAPLPKNAAINPSRVVSYTGSWISDLAGVGVTRQQVSLEQVPRYLLNATIAVEDTSFYSHSGFNLKGIARAMLVNLGAGRVMQGGSTITQQLAKNLFLNGNRTIWRKIQEALYAMQLETHLSKNQILTDYLNIIYYGHGATGVGTAAHYFFGKPVQVLNLAESTMLAGLPKGPTLYSPFTHYSLAKERQRTVLQAMVHAGYITQAQAHQAFVMPLHFVVHRKPVEFFAPYFTDAVSYEAQHELHFTQDALYRGGYTIKTTLNPALQKAMDKAIATYIMPHLGLQVAAVALDTRTGSVLAYSGGRNYRTSPYDRVNAMRQPGSTFKPFVYATALDKGWTASMHMISEPRTIVYGTHSVYHVHNFADEYSYGPIDMKQAIARSDNVFAVTANMAAGPALVEETARRFGLPDDMHPYPALALGVFPVSPLQMARAYAALDNGGYLVNPHTIAAVTDEQGHVLYEAQTKHLLVENPSTSFILTDMMQSVMKPGGTGYRVAKSLPGDIAAKTGTTDTDAWMVGYTPDVVCAVWVGYDQMRPINSVQAHLAAPIFAGVMQEAIKEHPQATFTAPKTVTKVWIDPETGQKATSACPIRELDAFAVGTDPAATCMAHPEPTASLTERALNTIRSLFSWMHSH